MTAFEQEDLQFIDFPDDDRLWWIRWADEYCFPYPGTDSAGIRVSLESLPFEQFEQITPESPTSIVIPPPKHATQSNAADRLYARPGILVGGLPAIRIGDVYRRGNFMGALPFPEKTFRFDTTKTIPVIREVGEEKAPTPSGWISKKPCRTINPYDYNLPGLNPSRCLVIEGIRETIIIPCQEIFRIFFAPDTNLANALTQQHWEQAIESFVDRRETRIVPPNVWQVALRKRLSGASMRVLCALILDEHARIAAKRITSRFRTHENCWMETSFPFAPGLVEINARYVPMQTFDGKARLLITCINKASWPYASTIQRLEREKEPGGEQGVKIGSSLPRQVTRKLPGQEIDPQRQKIESETPNASMKPVSAFARGFSWENPPAIETIRVPSSAGLNPVEIRFAGSPPVEQPTSSTGVPKGGRTSSGTADITVQKERTFIARFHALKEIFDRMLSTDALDDWRLVPSSINPVSLQGITVWAIPNKTNQKSNAWCSIPGSKAPRVAVIFQLVKDTDSVYFLELETRHSESGFRYVLFAPKAGLEDTCISELLQVAANHEGVWPSPLKNGKNLPSLERALIRKHAYVLNKPTGDFYDTKHVLNETLITRTVQAFF
jgi:hypothetical protein